MKFIGGIASNTKGIFSDIVRDLGVDNDFLVLTSGTFSYESILAGLRVRSIFSNDVSLLTSIYGWGAVRNEMLKIEIKNPLFEKLKEFENRSIEDNLGIILSVYSASEYVTIGGVYGKWWREYFAHSIVDVFKKQKEGGAKILDKVRGLGIKDFFGVDLVDLIDDPLHRDKILVAFLPTYGGGYEKIYKFLNESISWNAPRYSLIDDSNYEDLNQRIVERGGIVIVDRASGISDLVASCETKGKKLFLHCKKNKKKYVVGLESDVKFLDVEIWDGVVREVEKVEVLPIENKQFCKIRGKFISVRNFALGSVDYPFGVFFDGKIVGLIGICNGYREGVFLLKTDMSLVNRNRISKLIVMLSCCDEVHDFINVRSVFKSRFHGLNTIVFTRNAVSMKYRGIAKIINRKEDRLVYFIPKIDGNAKEIFKLWLEKFYRD